MGKAVWEGFRGKPTECGKDKNEKVKTTLGEDILITGKSLDAREVRMQARALAAVSGSGSGRWVSQSFSRAGRVRVLPNNGRSLVSLIGWSWMARIRRMRYGKHGQGLDLVIGRGPGCKS